MKKQKTSIINLLSIAMLTTSLASYAFADEENMVTDENRINLKPQYENGDLERDNPELYAKIDTALKAGQISPTAITNMNADIDKYYSSLPSDVVDGVQTSGTKGVGIDQQQDLAASVTAQEAQTLATNAMAEIVNSAEVTGTTKQTTGGGIFAAFSGVGAVLSDGLEAVATFAGYNGSADSTDKSANTPPPASTNTDVPAQTTTPPAVANVTEQVDPAKAAESAATKIVESAPESLDPAGNPVETTDQAATDGTPASTGQSGADETTPENLGSDSSQPSDSNNANNHGTPNNPASSFIAFSKAIESQKGNPAGIMQAVKAHYPVAYEQIIRDTLDYNASLKSVPTAAGKADHQAKVAKFQYGEIFKIVAAPAGPELRAVLKAALDEISDPKISSGKFPIVTGKVDTIDKIDGHQDLQYVNKTRKETEEFINNPERHSNSTEFANILWNHLHGEDGIMTQHKDALNKIMKTASKAVAQAAYDEAESNRPTLIDQLKKASDALSE